MRILLTNDDGIASKGIEVLKRCLQALGEVTVVAPESEQSASGHSITVVHPLRVTPYEKNRCLFGSAVAGTPADCVKMAVKALLKRSPDLVVSGINYGLNVGTNILYSGTVSAAIESTLLGIPAVAVSLQDKGVPRWETAARWTVRIIRKALARGGLPPKVLLNINVPNLPLERIRGVRVTKQGVFKYTDLYERRLNPRQQVYYWLTAERLKRVEDPDSDLEAVEQGYVSVCPLHYDMTCYPVMGEIKSWLDSHHRSARRRNRGHGA